MLTTMDRTHYYEATILGEEELPPGKKVVAGPFRVEAEDADAAERLAAEEHGCTFSRIDGIEITQVDEAEFTTNGRDRRVRESKTVVMRRIMRPIRLQVAQAYQLEVADSVSDHRQLSVPSRGRSLLAKLTRRV